MNISIAGESDIPPLMSLVNGAYRGEGSKKGWTTEADLLDGERTNEQALAAAINTAGAVILVNRDDAGIINACVYLQKQGNQLYLGMLSVSPLLQAKGIGGRLLRAAEDYAKKEHCYIISMTVISVRHELIAWYQKHGYITTGATKPFPADAAFGVPKLQLEFLVMEKVIAG